MLFPCKIDFDYCIGDKQIKPVTETQKEPQKTVSSASGEFYNCDKNIQIFLEKSFYFFLCGGNI